jgi:dTDP-glucose 4,6-dehydratase
VLTGGPPGETYHISGSSERTNIQVVTAICDLVDEMAPQGSAGPRRNLIAQVKDRPGHDRRYAMDSTKIRRELAWQPSTAFEAGLRKTVRWYLDHPEWVKGVRTSAHLDWIEQNYTLRPDR